MFKVSRCNYKTKKRFFTEGVVTDSQGARINSKVPTIYQASWSETKRSIPLPPGEARLGRAAHAALNIGYEGKTQLAWPFIIRNIY